MRNTQVTQPAAGYSRKGAVAGRGGVKVQGCDGTGRGSGGLAHEEMSMPARPRPAPPAPPSAVTQPAVHSGVFD